MKYTCAFLVMMLLLSGLKAQKPLEIEARDIQNNYIWSSSQLSEKYSVVNLLDKDTATAWVEGAEDEGLSEYILISIDKYHSDIQIANGYQKSLELFKANNRLKAMKISLMVGYNLPGMVSEIAAIFEVYPLKQDFIATFRDSMMISSVALPFEWNLAESYVHDLLYESYESPSEVYVQYFLKLEILDVYKGNKWDDTGISEIDLTTSADQYPRDLFVTEDEKAVFLVKGNEVEELISSEEHMYQIVDISKYRDWVILIEMPATVGNSRAETHYILMNTLSKKKLTDYMPEIQIGEIYEFSYRGKDTFVEYLDPQSLELKTMKLDF